MEVPLVRVTGVLALCLCTAGAAFGQQTSNPSAPVRSANYKLADELLAWYEAQHIKGMQLVDGSTTDVGQMIKETGLDVSIEHFAARRRPMLEYAASHLRDEKIPDADLDRIARRQMEEVVENASISKKYIDYNKTKLQEGLTEAYRLRSRAWIAFFRKLLAAPAPAANTGFKEFVRTAVPREEYVKLIDQVVAGTTAFYTGLRAGISWYSLTGPWVRSKLEKSSQQENGISRATVDEIYGKPK